MKKLLAVVMAISLILPSFGSVCAEELFPLIVDHPEGIEDLDDMLISDEIREKNIQSGFEEQQEISIVEGNSFEGQRKIVENCFAGKFALQIEQNGEDILPLMETEYFDIESLSETKGEYSKSEDGITIVTVGKNVTISGTAKPNTEVTVTINRDNDIEYLNQTTSDSDGFFSFYCILQRYGTFKVYVNRVGQESYQTDMVCASVTNTNGIKELTAKTNLVSMQVKPMYKAEKISFYTKAKVKTDTGSEEKYVLIKSDKNADGIYEIGEDLSLGKWQKVELMLTNIDEEYAEPKVSGIYIKANEASTWIFDDLSSDYKDINSVELDLVESAKGNVIYNDGLRFNTMDNGKFNTEAAIVSSGIDINEELHGISVETSTQSSGQISEEETETSKVLLDADFASDAWTVFGDGYSDATTSVSMKSGGSILMKPDGQVEFNVGHFSSAKRTKVSVDLSYISTSYGYGKSIKLELYSKDISEPYYRYSRTIPSGQQTSTLEYILPQIDEETIIKLIYKESSKNTEIEISDFEICSLTREDWNLNDKYKYRRNIICFSESGNYIAKSVTDLPSFEEHRYAVENENIRGVACTKNDAELSISYTEENNFVIRMVNLSLEPQTISVGSSSYTLPFGECDIVASARGTISIPANEDVLLVSVCEYSSVASAQTVYFKNIDGMGDNVVISSDGNKIYYNNYLDCKSLYVYDIITETTTKLLDKEAIPVCVSKDNRQVVYILGSKYYLLNLESDESREIPIGEKYSFNSRGELFYTAEDENEVYQIYRYTNGVLEDLFEGSNYTMDTDGNHILVYQHIDARNYKYDLYKCYNGAFALIESLTVSNKYTIRCLSDDLSTFYTTAGTAVDIKTGTEKGSIGSIRYKAQDNTFIVESMSLYNPATGETYKIASVVGDVVHYNPDTGMLTAVYNGAIARCKFTAEKSSAKYLLSFDGQNTWQSYKNGRWVTVAKGAQPTQTEMDALGMSSDELNNISAAAYKKLYASGTDILRVDIAIYMNSYSSELTPVISNITVKTVADDETRDLFSVKSKCFDKAEYTKIESIFPVEDFTDASECYYLLYLGNDWLYTYKNNEIIRVSESANELLAEMNSTWIKFKQYAMTAKELRNIPSEILTELLINPDYANDKFGIVYVMKGENENANVVTFKVQADTKYIDTDEVVIEIVMNGNDTKVIDSREFSKEVIENFLSWLENRQNGKGEIFYNFKNGPMQYFINYYMINSINVYDAAGYAQEETSKEQTAVVTE